MDMTADQTLQESCMSALRHMGVEVTALVNKANRLEAENDKLRRAFNETLARLSAANEVAVVNYMDGGYCEMLHEMGIEVGE